jgi:hypothetical protein
MASFAANAHSQLLRVSASEWAYGRMPTRDTGKMLRGALGFEYRSRRKSSPQRIMGAAACARACLLHAGYRQRGAAMASVDDAWEAEDMFGDPEQERCCSCHHVMMGMILPACRNRASEFYGGAVHPDGWCSSYEPAGRGDG